MRSECSHDGCARVSFRRGVCKYHYAEGLRSGVLPRLRRHPSESLEEYAQKKREQARDYRLRHPERVRSRIARWREANVEEQNEKERKRRRFRRVAVLETLGGRCALGYEGICGGDYEHVLDVDHINGGGGAEVRLRKRHSSAQIAYEDLREHGPDYVRSKYQLLCCNCHRVKTRGLVMGDKDAAA